MADASIPPPERVAIVAPTYPPQICGVGDYSATLARMLAERWSVSVWTRRVREAPHHEPGEVEVFRSWGDGPAQFAETLAGLQKLQPRFCIFQYDPFAFGFRYGLSGQYARFLQDARRVCPGIIRILTVHEGIVEPTPTWKKRLLAYAHRRQLLHCAAACERVILSTQTWYDQLRNRIGTAKCEFIPVGCSFPVQPSDREMSRAELGLGKNEFVVGFFGRSGKAKAVGMVRAVMGRLISTGRAVRLLYLGSDVEAARSDFSGLPVLCRGPLSVQDVSRFVQTVDLYLVPLAEGVSSRRTSLALGLSHGLPVLATHGPATDSLLREANGTAFILTPGDDTAAMVNAAEALFQDPARRLSLAQQGQRFHDNHYSWPAIAARYRDVLDRAVA